MLILHSHRSLHNLTIIIIIIIITIIRTQHMRLNHNLVFTFIFLRRHVRKKSSKIANKAKTNGKLDTLISWQIRRFFPKPKPQLCNLENKPMMITLMKTLIVQQK